MLKLAKTLTLLGNLFWIGTQALAYPEMIRHGYVNCTSCHVSPTGGGTLTEYGRSLSDEVMSAWSAPGESGFLYGTLPTTQRFQFGGDVRGLQLQQKTSAKSSSKTVFMQGDFEAAIKIGKWSALASAGVEESEGGSGGGEEEGDSLAPISRKHWVGYQLNDNIMIRAGKFQRAFLFNTAEHETLLKQLSGLDVGTETYNIEGSYLSEGGEFFLTANLGRPDKSALDVESGTTIKGAMNLGTNSKLGLQYDYERNSQKTQHLMGPYLALGLGERAIVLSEFAVNRGAKTGKDATTGLTTYTRISYETFRGGWLYGIHEWTKPDFQQPVSFHVGSLGFQFFPRPHFEFNLMVQRMWLHKPAGEMDMALLLGHFYL